MGHTLSSCSFVISHWNHKEGLSEFIPLKNYFFHPIYARGTYQTLLFYGIMFFSPTCHPIIAVGGPPTSSPLALVCMLLLNPRMPRGSAGKGQTRLISVVTCKDLRKGKISDLYETLEHLLSTNLFQEDAISNTSGLRALCSSPPPSEICVELKLNCGTYLIKRQMAK